MVMHEALTVMRKYVTMMRKDITDTYQHETKRQNSDSDRRYNR